jgi:CubicO group peptidase (beta-lactamase class C family)
MTFARRAPLLVTALLGLACTPAEAPHTAKSAEDAAPVVVKQFARPSLPMPVFTDPARKQKLASAFPEIERFLTAEFERMALPGAAFGVVVDGELVFVKTLGVTDIETKKAVDADTLFRIASITKGFTAMAVMKLRDEGKLSLDDPAERHVPELARLAYPTRDAAPITIRQLLSHGGGFPEDNPWGDRQLGLSEKDFSRMLEGGFPFSTSPNSAFEYSNLGFAILGRIVSKASGIDYADYLRASVLGPLGMTSTVLDERAAPKGPSSIARGYRREDGKLVVEQNLPHGAFGAMGGLYSSLNDMARYVSFHLSAWPARDEAERGPLRRSSTREMHGIARAIDLRASPGLEDQRPSVWSGGYAFGLGTFETCELSHGVSHTGGLPGYGSVIQFLPDHGVGFIGMANVKYASMSRLGREVLRRLRDTGGLLPRAAVPSEELLKAKSAVAKLLAKWSDAEADAAFAGSLFLDRPRAEITAELDALRKAHGACQDGGEIEAENALRGTYRLTCERGFVDVAMTLAPTVPAKVQYLSTRGGFAPTKELTVAGDKLVSMLNRWSDATAAGTFDATAEVGRMKALLSSTKEARGACTVAEPMWSDGATHVNLRLSCEKYPVIVEIATTATGKITSVKFAALPGLAARCAG